MTTAKDQGAGSPKTRRGLNPENIAHLNWPLHIFLWITGVLICTAILIESYLQLKGSSYHILGFIQNFGFLEKYTRADSPSKGIWHLIGIVGSACFIIMMSYSIRKRFSFMVDVGSLRSWLDVHMFLGIVGTILTTTHTTYKFGGLVSISFWCMVIVASSGLLGRYLYGWIPHQVSGKELEMEEIRAYLEASDQQMQDALGKDPQIVNYYDRISSPPGSDQDNAVVAIFKMFFYDLANTLLIGKIWVELMSDKTMPTSVKKQLFSMIREKNNMLRSRNFLSTAQRLLHYWHVFHKPLAVMMFIVMFIHIIVWYLFGAHEI
ncbi:MAG: hypothetical protein OEZ55_01925 [Nitrospinota bacterium]|nr:hypothetical protein [Nitrospinota bacterium]